MADVRLFDAEGRISLNDRALASGLRGAKRKVAKTMDEIRAMRAEAEIRADITDVEKKAKAAVKEIRRIDKMTADPEFRGDKSQFDRVYKELQAQVAKMDGRKIELKIELDRRNSAIRAVTKDFRALRAEADKGETIFTRAFRSLSGMTLRLGPFTGSIKQFAIALSLIAPQIMAVIGAASALIGVLGSGIAGALSLGAGAMAGFGLSALGVGLILKPLVQDLGKAKTASDAYNKAVLEHGKNSDQAAKKLEVLNNVLKGTTSGTKEAFKNAGELAKTWHRLTKESRPAFFDTIGEGLKTAQALMPDFARQSNATFLTAAQGVQKWLQGLRSPAAHDAMVTLMENSRAALTPLMDGLGALGTAFRNVAVSASAFLEPAAAGFNTWAQGLATASGDTTNLDAKMKIIMGDAQAVGGLFMDAARAAKTFFGAGRKDGRMMIDDMRAWLRERDKAMKTPEGQEKLQKFFKNSREDANEIWKAAATAAVMFNTWADALQPISESLLKAVNGLGKIVKFVSQLPGFSGAIQILFAAFVAKRIFDSARALAIFGRELRALARTKLPAAVLDWFGMGGGKGKAKGPKGGGGPVAVPTPDAGKTSGRFGALGKAAGIAFRVAFVFELVNIGSKLAQGKSLRESLNLEKEWYQKGLGGKALRGLGLVGPPFDQAAWDKAIATQDKFYNSYRKNIAGIPKGPTKTPFVMPAVGPILSQLVKLNNYKLDPKQVRIVQRGGPEAVRMVERLRGVKLTPKQQRIIERGGDAALRLVRRLQAAALRRKIQQINQRGAEGVWNWIKKLRGTPLGKAIKHLTDNGTGGKVKGIMDRLASMTNLGRALKTIVVNTIGKGVGGLVGGSRAAGGSFREDPVERGLREAADGRTGGRYSKPTFLVGDHASGPAEMVISPDPAYRRQNISYWQQAAKLLGIPGFGGGGPTATGGKVQGGGAPHYSENALDTMTGPGSTIAKQQRKIEGMEGKYTRLERGLSLDFGDTELINQDGTRNESAIRSRMNQIQQLINLKDQIADEIRHLQVYIETTLSTVRDAITQMVGAFRSMAPEVKKYEWKGSGKNKKRVWHWVKNERRASLGELIDKYRGAVPGLEDEKMSAQGALEDNLLDVRDLYAQKSSISNTKETSTPAERTNAGLEGALALANITPGANVSGAIQNLINFNQEQIRVGQGMLSDSDPTNDTAAWGMIQTAANNVASYTDQLGGVGGASGGGGSAGIVSDMSAFNQARYDLYAGMGNMQGGGSPASPGSSGPTVVNNYQFQPEDPHTWAQQTAWELEAVLG